MLRSSFVPVLIAAFLLLSPGVSASPDPETLVRDAINHWRGTTSHVSASMEIQRPGWKRTMGFEGWTRGEEDSLVRFTEPAKDAGNATLVKGKEMWSFSPRVNRVVRIPPSMMSQSWMGSDFSHSDLSKQADVIEEYTHTLKETATRDGHTIYVVESVPKESSSVVWGKETFVIRDDFIILERSFFDQDLVLVKQLIASEIARSGKGVFARRARMQNKERPEEFTEVFYHTVQFDLAIGDEVFSLSALQR